MDKLNKPLLKRWWVKLLLVFAAITLALAIAFGFYILKIIKNIKNSQISGDITLNRQIEPELEKLIYGNQDNYWLGSANPKISIVIFSDFACPYCANSFPNIREISTKYKDSVKIIFRDFPLVSENSPMLALAARCAGEQGLFWVMHDRLFIKQGIRDNSGIIQAALQSGVNMEKFRDCLDSDRQAIKIQKDLSDARMLELAGTPTYFINGNRLSGDVPYQVLEQIIETLLNIKK